MLVVRSLVVLLGAALLTSCSNRPPRAETARAEPTAGDEVEHREDVGALAADDGPSIRLCAWNVKKLGHGTSTDYAAVARVLDENCDASVIVEVMQRQGSHPGYDTLLATMDGWEGVVTDTPRPFTNAGHAEFYAVVWRTSSGVSLCDDWTRGLVFHNDNDGGPNGAGDDFFAREPAYVCLQHATDGRRTIDFLVAAYHATWADGHTPTIAAEVAHVTGVVDAMREARPGERDLFVMGDFNLVPDVLASTLNYADRTTGTGSTLNSSGAITTNLYDHLLVVDEEASTEVRGNALVLDVRGVAANEREFYRTVSDHLPIVFSVSTAGGDDD